MRSFDAELRAMRELGLREEEVQTRDGLGRGYFEHLWLATVRKRIDDL
jgi:hypothetical protein